MLIVAHLAWPILFGQNHLKATQALIDHANLRIKFQHPDLNYVIQCPDTNPHPFPKPSPDSNAKTSPQNQNLPNARPIAQITCLLTGLFSPHQEHRRIAIHKGLTFIIVCLVLSSSSMGTSSLSSDFWIHGNEIAPGVQVLSGPTNFATNGFIQYNYSVHFSEQTRVYS